MAHRIDTVLGKSLIAWRRHGMRRASIGFRLVRRRVATVVGAVVLGLIALGFAWLSDAAQTIFGTIITRWRYAPLAITPFTFAAVVWITRRWAPDARGSGIPQVIAAGQTADRALAFRLVSVATAVKKLALTVIMLLVGASVGREGPTVQISAAVMVWCHRVLRVPITAGVLIAGGAAGVAAAFNTPLAGVAFAIEELAAAYEQRIAILVMGAVMIAGLTSLGIAGDYVYFGAMRHSLPLRSVLLVAPVAGVLGGLAGGAFSRVVLHFSGVGGRLVQSLRRHPVAFAGACGGVVAVLGIASGGATWGTGYGATRALVEGSGGSPWFGAAKLAATLATTLSGAPGGIFAPSLAVGAGLGSALVTLFPTESPGAIVVIAMVAYFVGVVRAPFTAVIIVSEATAARGMIVPMFVAALIADAVSARVCRERLYHGLSRAFLAEQASHPHPQTPPDRARVP